MLRRQFLATSAAAAAPFALRGMPVAAASSPLFDLAAAADNDRVLVLVQLSGGNDGLASLVPLDQYDQLAQVRANVIVPEAQLVDLEPTRALHPSLADLKALWDDGQLGIVQDVGYPDQNRSHFRSTDIWHSGSPSDEVWTSGWVGRHLDARYPGFPDGYPNTEHPDPVAVVVGNSVSATCQGIAGNFGLTVANPDYVTQIIGGSSTDTPATPYGRELAFLRTSIEQANAYGAVVTDAVEGVTNAVAYPEDSTFATRLSYIARMIAGGLRTRVYVVTLGGFDTHAEQVVEGEPTSGEHAELLRQLAEGLKAFQADLTVLGVSERVVGMTYSEFGRRIRSNAAYGTDHGTAAPAFLFGDCVQAGTLGDNPVIDTAVDELEGVPMQYDFRDLYGTVLEDWFGVAESDVRALLHAGYTRLPILRPCDGSVSDLGAAPAAQTDLAVAPSPFGDHARLSFETAASGRVRLEAYDVKGGLVETLFERRLPAGEQTVTVDASRYPAGVIVFRLTEPGGRVRVVRAVRNE